MTDNQINYTTIEVGSTIQLRLPPIDTRWRLNHNEEPYMLFPGEVTKEYADGKGNSYCISNYCRVYSYKKKAMVKAVPSLYFPTWLHQNFTEEELDNEYTRHNLEVISPVNYYKNHREERLAYQKNYRDTNLEKVRANEKRYREANKEKLLEMSRQRRANKKANMTEEERAAARAKAREYYRQRKERIANALANQGLEPTESNETNETSLTNYDNTIFEEQ